IKYVSEPDKGVYEAMNKGVKMAKGKYIAFLNSDDFYHNLDAVKLSVEALEKNNADFSYANFFVIGKGEKKTVRACIENFLFTMPFGHPTMFAKTSILRSENGFDEKFGLPADYDLVIRLILKDYRGIFVDKEIATYRLGGLGCTNEHSDEITQIYLKNYSAFYDFSDPEQAKKIMYELTVPEDFPAKFKEYADRQGLKNIDVEKIVSDLEMKASKSVKCAKDLKMSNMKKIGDKIKRYLIRN
ncbi:MAG: glycosyltransferase, partial [Candidatus Moranbacteria bacterium]|nr:glycosyltransferase [Candidatus Moranbacteria bacterium]